MQRTIHFLINAMIKKAPPRDTNSSLGSVSRHVHDLFCDSDSLFSHMTTSTSSLTAPTMLFYHWKFDEAI